MTQKQFDKNFNSINLLKEDGSEVEDDKIYKWCFMKMKQSFVELLTLGLSECIGTAMLLFFGCMGCVDFGAGGFPNHLSICLGFGLTVMVIVNIFGIVSGAHLNPAVTLAAYVYKLVDLQKSVVYVIGQFTGAFLGYGLLRALTPDSALGESFCVTLPGEKIDIWKAFGVEFFITMGLILVCCGVWDPRNAKHHDSVPLRFGLAITMLALVGGPYSGGSMNPARSFAPALYNMNFTAHWIYWVAPMLSALITSVTFRMVFYREAPKELTKPEEIPLRDAKNNV
ncbi:aquaporin AQPAe.a-like isoform X1 [Chironomus tepperi]|uniref:aquaporin AQPAe.a-like isoform X1 n=2 Tax=Chironomus tepperi TaxID=113505 RepID=UPI00391F454E